MILFIVEFSSLMAILLPLFMRYSKDVCTCSCACGLQGRKSYICLSGHHSLPCQRLVFWGEGIGGMVPYRVCAESHHALVVIVVVRGAPDRVFREDKG